MLKQERKKELANFVKTLNLDVSDFEILNLALTHGSYNPASRKTFTNNERLEFFGDAVLKLFISEYLMSKYNNFSEGELSKVRAYVVSEKVLAKIADKLQIKKYILMGKNEGKNPPLSILADSVEALLAVVYYECGAEKTRNFILENWELYIDSSAIVIDTDNYKAVLQEHLQANKSGLPIYKTISESGPDHLKQFEVGVYLNTVFLCY